MLDRFWSHPTRTEATLGEACSLRSFSTVFYGSAITFNCIVYFAADDGTHSIELWTTDGTPEGAVMLQRPAARHNLTAQASLH